MCKIAKKVLSGVIFVIFLLTLTGCQEAAPAESVIQEEISQVAGYYIEEEIDISQIEIDKRLTDENIDISYCSVLAEGTIATYNMYFWVEYKYYDKGGWLLENLSIDRQEEWSATYKADNLKTVEDIELEEDKIYIEYLDKDEMTFSWEPNGVFCENGKYIQNFSGAAVYSNEICKIDVPVLFYYTFETKWLGDVFCANWESTYKQKARTSECMEVDMSGIWVGNTIRENIGSDVMKLYIQELSRGINGIVILICMEMEMTT